MDARIDVLRALGMELGDAHVIRNAGARVTDDVLRSLALSTQVLDVNSVVLLQHSRCGVAGVTDDELRTRTGAPISFHAISDHAASLADDLDQILRQRYLAPIRSVIGAVLDVETGAVDEVLRWERTSPAHPTATPTKHGIATLMG